MKTPLPVSVVAIPAFPLIIPHPTWLDEPVILDPSPQNNKVKPCDILLTGDKLAQLNDPRGGGHGVTE